MRTFLGVDGGNTKTLAIVADEQGCILGSARAGNGDIYGAASPAAAMAAVGEAVEKALDASGQSAKPLSGAAYSIAGADWSEDHEFIAGHVAKFCTGSIVVNDCIGALRSGTKDGVGVAVICGTYGTCGAQSRDGKRWFGGFWHRAEGGAVPLGQAVWEAVLDAEMGISGATALTEAVLGLCESPSVEDLLHRISRRGAEYELPRGRMARLLLEAALEGDATALNVVNRHGDRAAEYAIAAAQLVGLGAEPFPLVLTGGVMRFAPNPLRARIVEAVLSRFPHAVPMEPRFQPVVGALMLAYDAAGIRVDPSTEANLSETGPCDTFFDS